MKLVLVGLAMVDLIAAVMAELVGWVGSLFGRTGRGENDKLAQ